MGISSFIFGNPLKTENLASQQLTKIKALATFSSDVLSTVSYATEEILLTLGAVLAMTYSLPLCAAIVVLLFILVTSYWQIMEAYPNGGGSFAVAYENFGEFSGLIAASALLIAYTLTVAVSLSAGIRSLISAFPGLQAYDVTASLVALIIITIANLRGTQESANIFSIPTYCFIGLILLMIICGFFTKPEAAKLTTETTVAAAGINMGKAAVVFIVLRAFSAGCSALTGIDSIASSVTGFKPPQYKNAQITLLIMALILSTMFSGISFLAYKFHINFSESETVISQISKIVFGSGFFYYSIQLMTACILLMAANTAFSSFPRLASILGKEKYLPTRFANLGDRLAYSNGIVALALIATILIWIFQGDTHALIPIYAFSVFISFTLAQAGMIKKLLNDRPENWYLKAGICFIGVLATSLTLLIITAESGFFEGAWVVLILIPIFLVMFIKINRRYRESNIELDLKRGGLGDLLRPFTETSAKVVVPVSRIHKATLAALRFAASLSDDVVAVVVNMDQKETDRLKLAWRSMNFNIPLVVLSSPYRSIVNPFIDFLYEQDERDPEKGKTIVVMPSFVPGKFWQNILHNQTATIFKTALLYRTQKSEQTRIIVEIPYQMKF